TGSGDVRLSGAPLGLLLVGPGIGQTDPEPTTPAFVFLAARPLDPKIVRDLPVRHPEFAGDLYREFVGFDLGRPIYVAVTPIPELLSFVPLPNVDELVEDVQVQRALLPALQVVQPDHDVPLLVVDVRVGVFRNEVDEGVPQDRFPETVVVNETLPMSVPFHPCNDLDDRPSPGGGLAVNGYGSCWRGGD